MGCFDYVRVSCPKCGSAVEFQSKAGECLQGCYDIEAVPVEVAYSLKGKVEACGCGEVLTLRLEDQVDFVRMKVE